MTHLRLIALSLASIGLVAASGCSDDNNDTSGSLRVQNNSDFEIVEIHVTSVGSSTWGPNLIPGDTLAPGDGLTLDVSCDTYDALLIDESGVDCQIHDVDLCLNNADWIINNNTCTVFAAARAAREAAAKASGSAAPATR